MGATNEGGTVVQTSDAVAGRVRRPSWRDPRLLIGLALIALAVAAVVLIVERSDTTEPFYAASRDLAPGTVLAKDDLVVVHVRVSSGEYVSQPDAVVGKVLDRTVGAGGVGAGFCAHQAGRVQGARHRRGKRDAARGGCGGWLARRRLGHRARRLRAAHHACWRGARGDGRARGAGLARLGWGSDGVRRGAHRERRARCSTPSLPTETSLSSPRVADAHVRGGARGLVPR